MAMNFRTKSGWHNESHRHSLAARGVQTNRYMAKKVKMAWELDAPNGHWNWEAQEEQRPGHFFGKVTSPMEPDGEYGSFTQAELDSVSAKRYMASKVGVSAAEHGGEGIVDQAFSMGRDKYSIAGAFEKGEEVMPLAGSAGESALPDAYEKGMEWTPITDMGVLDSAFESGKGHQESAMHAFQAHKEHSGYEHVPNLQSKEEIYEFEERTGRKHEGEPLKHYLKRSATEEVPEKELDFAYKEHLLGAHKGQHLNIDARDMHEGETRRIPIKEVDENTYR